MIRVLFFLQLFFCFASLNAQTPESLAKKWLYAITSADYSGRRAGTEGCRKACRYLNEQLLSLGYVPEVTSFNYNGAILRNIVVPLGDVRDTVIVIGAHYDGQFESTSYRIYPAADDNASGVVSLLLLLEKLKTKQNQLHYPILACFWDGEEYCYGEIFKGSRYFVEHNKKIILYYINIDAVGHDHNDTNTMSFLYRGDGVSSVVKDLLRSNKFTFRYFKAQKGFGASDQVPFDNKDIPYISFYDSPASKHKECGHNLHTVNDIPEAVSIDRMVVLSDLIFSLLINHK